MDNSVKEKLDLMRTSCGRYTDDVYKICISLYEVMKKKQSEPTTKLGELKSSWEEGYEEGYITAIRRAIMQIEELERSNDLKYNLNKGRRKGEFQAYG
jgi:hypothetical protein